jgi:hypothetical protein
MNTDKRNVESVIVKRLHHMRSDRGMTLMNVESRCVQRGEVHELVTTDQLASRPGDQIDRVGFIGFVEILNAGVIEIGDVVLVNDNKLGRVVGFDGCHFPNHYNVLVGCDRLWTSDGLQIDVDQPVVFT